MCARVQLGTLQPAAAQVRTHQWTFGCTYPSAHTHAHASSLPNGDRKEVRGLRADDMENEEMGNVVHVKCRGPKTTRYGRNSRQLGPKGRRLDAEGEKVVVVDRIANLRERDGCAR